MKKGKKAFLAVLTVVMVFSTVTISSMAYAYAENYTVSSLKNGDVAYNKGATDTYSVGNYSDTNSDIDGAKLVQNDPELAEKSWFEYLEYSLWKTQEGTAANGDADVKYYMYQPDYSSTEGRAMAIGDFNPDTITGATEPLGISWSDFAPIFYSVSTGAVATIAAGGITSGTIGAVAQNAQSDGIFSAMEDASSIVKNAPYYAASDFMGIPNDEKYGGISNSGFYTASSITVTMQKSSAFNTAKTYTTNSSISIGGNTSVSTEAEAGAIFAKTKVSAEIGASAGSSLGYGLNYQMTQQASVGKMYFAGNA